MVVLVSVLFCFVFYVIMTLLSFFWLYYNCASDVMLDDVMGVLRQEKNSYAIRSIDWIKACDSYIDYEISIEELRYLLTGLL